MSGPYRTALLKRREGCLLILPDEVVAQMGWREHDLVEVTAEGSRVVIKWVPKTTRGKRSEVSP